MGNIVPAPLTSQPHLCRSDDLLVSNDCHQINKRKQKKAHLSQRTPDRVTKAVARSSCPPPNRDNVECCELVFFVKNENKYKRFPQLTLPHSTTCPRGTPAAMRAMGDPQA